MLTFTTYGHEWSVSAPYHAGSVLTEAEATALNELRRENIRKMFMKRKEWGGSGSGSVDQSLLAATLASLDTNYTFGLAKGKPSGKLSPLELEIKELAWAEAEVLAKPGQDIDLLAQALAEEAWLQAKARQRLAQRHGIGERVMQDLLGADPGPGASK